MVSNMQNLMSDLMKLFMKDDRIYANGRLLKNKATELALKLDQFLIELLLSNKKATEHFFIELTLKGKKVLIFDKDKFVAFINNKEFLPDSFTSFKNKIGLITNDDYLKEKGDVVLAWPYKDCVLEGGQDREDQKRNEIFYNEILSPDEIDRLLEPKVLTNFIKYDSKGEHKITKINNEDNLIIKGNNLLALSCLQPYFRHKVKLIYIDPPYNTGSDDFQYNDHFNHSTWLTFMKNRLNIAVGFLTEDGSIWINIGDEEAHYLKVLMDEIMPNGFVANIIWQKRTSPDARKPLGDAHDHILVYANDIKLFRSRCRSIPLTEGQKAKFSNPDKDPRGPWVSTDFTATGYRPNQMYKIQTPSGNNYSPPPRKCWSKIESEYLKLKNEGRIWYGIKGDAMPRRKTYLSETEGIVPWTWWDNKDVGHNQEAKQESIALFGVDQPFSTPKPERLLKRIIEIATSENDYILDFFAGSGTTSAVAHKMKRKYISIEQLRYSIPYNKERLIKVIAGEKGGISKLVNWQGGDSFLYAELLEWNEQYLKAIQKVDTSRKLLNIYEQMKKEAFFRYDIDLSKFENKHFDKLSLKEQKIVLCECLDKNHLYVNLSELDDATYKINSEDKKLNKEFYKVVV